MLLRLLYGICWFLSRPLIWWMRHRAAPEGLPDSLGLDPARPVCFVLPYRSWLDVFALQGICRAQGLPAPRPAEMRLPEAGETTFIYLETLLESKRDAEALQQLFASACTRQDYELQLVPVSVFWGRAPGSETSLFRILFADSVGVGRLHKLFIALVNGRNVFAHFAKPVGLRAFAHDQGQPQRALRKLSRVFNIHFLRVRTATLGPTLVRRSVIIDGLLRSPAVRQAIAREVAAGEKSEAKVHRRARAICDEIAANYSTTTLSFLERVMTQVFNRIFRGIDARGLERVRALAQTHEVIYLASHRSHLDYLLISYVLYHAGVVPPHIAAGVNLNFWPIGGMLRRGGAFYLRRSFKGDALYTTIFRSYVDMLIARGYSISFYPEGGRSRTGRLLSPKTGLMAMVVESALRQRTRKVAIVPIYVGYDRVPEAGSYARELRGAQKQKESAQGLLKATRVLTKSFGKPYISFGEPLRLQEFADGCIDGWRQGFGTPLSPQRPDGFNDMIAALAAEVMRRINAAVVAYPVALTAVALLAAPQKAASEADLRYQVDLLIRLLKAQPYSPTMVLPEERPDAVLEWAAPIARLSRIPHDWGDLLIAEGKEATLLTYYRNNIQHLFALPSLIASMFRSRERMREDELIDAAEALYPFLRTEFYLVWPDAQSREVLSDTLRHMCALGLVRPVEDGYARPPVASVEFAALSMLSRIMGETLERYCMTAVMLAAKAGRDAVARADFENDVRSLAERLAVLTGRMAPEFFDQTLFRGYVDTLLELGLLRADAEGLLKIDARIHPLADSALTLLSADIQQVILQLVEHRNREAASDDKGV